MNDLAQCGASEPFALRVIGDDMAPEFCDGHIVVIDPGGQIKDGCFVVAKFGEEAVLRQLSIEDSKYYLSSLGDGESKLLLGNDLNSILGVVSQRAGRRRRESKRYDV